MLGTDNKIPEKTNITIKPDIKIVRKWAVNVSSLENFSCFTTLNDDTYVYMKLKNLKDSCEVVIIGNNSQEAKIPLNRMVIPVLIRSIEIEEDVKDSSYVEKRY